jgi:hypothetical protein
MQLAIHPLTPDLWPALEDLFGEQGAVNGCWCMYWRIGSDYRRRPLCEVSIVRCGLGEGCDCGTAAVASEPLAAGGGCCG